MAAPKTESGLEQMGEDAASLTEKRRLLLLVRTGLTLAIGYLLIFSSEAPALPPALLAFVVIYLGSNVLIAALPGRVLASAAFDVGLVLVDTAAISFALYIMPDANTDVFVFYFVIILLASISDRLSLSLFAPAVTSLAYFAFLFARYGAAGVLKPAILLRMPFFLLAGAFYGFFVDRVRRGQIAAAAAKQREAARTEFLSLITHDLKQPLWVAQQSAALLYEQLGRDNAPPQKLAAQVMVSLRRMEALTMNFLDLGRIETRGIQVFPRCAPLNQLVADLVESYQPALDLKAVAVQLELDPTLPLAWIDPPQVERAFANLLDNAVKFTPEGGRIVLRTALEEGQAVVTIGDSGPGIGSERAATLFARFQNGSDTAGRRSTGLGLYISRAIAVAHGGDIALDAQATGGAWFRVRLPLAAPETKAPQAHVARSPRAIPAAVGERLA